MCPSLSRVIEAAERLFKGVRATMLPAFAVVYNELVEGLGCTPRVQTIYVGFSRGDKMLAAIHPSRDRFEIALPSGPTIDPIAYPAPHLKWPMLPRALSIVDVRDAQQALPVLRLAATLLDEQQVDGAT
jgi:hypothetical protein